MNSLCETGKQAKGVKRIQAVERAIRMLTCFSEDSPRLTLGELAAGIGTNKATAHRYAVSLVEAGMLCYDSQTALYSMSFHVISMAAAALSGVSFMSMTHEHMEQLQIDVGETITLGLWDDLVGSVIISHVVYSDKDIVSLRVILGDRLSPDTAHGKVFKAFRNMRMENDEQDREIDPEILKIRRDGLVTHEPGGYWAIAAPVFEGDRLIASITIIGIGDKVKESKKSLIYKRLKDSTDELSKKVTILRRVAGDT
ncbi:MAG: helix-turn-helix domain-containing protein [Anaerolineales bacterium]|nr:helix-turn-helix domain-containing protein [Anaerolineales bacterium]